jgi:capsular polysaccharide transport system permease protein
MKSELLELTAATPIPERPSLWRRVVGRVDAIFVATVVVPTMVASVYYGLIASDVYISESHFIVRSQQRQAPTGLGALLQSSGLARSQDDTYSVIDFVRSRDALRELDQKLKLRSAYSDSQVDFVNRFPGFDRDDSFEALFRQYEKYIDVNYDSGSAIAVLSVRAYKAADAVQTNELLLQMGERLVNELNVRSRRDLIEVAEAEVRVAEVRSKAAAQALSGFRAERQVFDPERQGAVEIQGAAKLREELVEAEAQLAQVKSLSPQNPQVAALSERVVLLRQAIKNEDARLLAREGGLTSKSPAYDKLLLEKTFADRQLAATLTELDSARSDAARQQLYLERLVQPSVPDSALEPRRLRSVFTVLVLGLVGWGIVSLIVASIREHAD